MFLFSQLKTEVILLIKVLGIVAEYNPFHNGHATLIALAKKQGYSHCITVMSGNYVQRAQPAITEKRVRTHAALLNGVDLVLELPLPYATATAQKFAYGSIALLQATSVVDSLCFGSELGAIAPLKELAHLLESPILQAEIAPLLQQGITFAKARQLAVEALAGKEVATILAEPNNILGIEYLRAMAELKWNADSFTIPRVAVGHHDTAPVSGFASASYLRKEPLFKIESYVPPSAYTIYKQAEQNGLYPVSICAMEDSILSYLRRLSPSDLLALPDLSEGIENRLCSAIATSTSLATLYEHIKTKRYPLSRVRRLVLSAYLGLTQTDLDTHPPYLRILGFNSKGKELLAKMNGQATLPFSSRLLDLQESSSSAMRFATLENQSTNLYALALPSPRPCGYEHSCSGVFL